MDLIELESLSKDSSFERAKELDCNDIDFLVDCLAEKNEKIRYPAFLLLLASSREFSFVYEYWNVLESKLDSDNSYQRSAGLKLIAENVKWDKNGKFAKTIDKYLCCCADEKFITARRAIQALETVIHATEAYNGKIKQNLKNLSLAKYKKSQAKLLKEDIYKIIRVIEQGKKGKFEPPQSKGITILPFYHKPDKR